MEEKNESTETGAQKPGKPEPGSAKMVRKRFSRGKKPVPLAKLAGEKRRVDPARPSLMLYTLLFIYKNLYVLGVTLMRRGLRLRRRIRLWRSIAKGRWFALLHRLKLFAGQVRRSFGQRMHSPFQLIGDTYRQQQPAIRAVRANGGIPLRAMLPVAEMVGRLALKVLVTLFNYTAPVFALVFLVTYVSEQLTQPYALRLDYDGHMMGYVRNESVFDEATQLVRARTIDQNVSVSIGSPTFEIEMVEVNADSLLESADLADMLMRFSGSETEQAYGLYVAGRFLGATSDKDAILNELDAIRAEGRTGKVDEDVRFAKSIRFEPALYLQDSVRPARELIEIMRGTEQTQETYIVRDNDTPTEIADKTGVPYSELRRLNPSIEESLFPGDELITRVARPFLSVSNTYTETYEDEIPYETVEVENGTYARGYEEIIQEGLDGLRRVVARVTTVNGVETGRTILNADDDSAIIRHPVAERIMIGINEPVRNPASQSSGGTGSTDTTPSSARSDGFIWPTVGGSATTYRNHTGNGVDIAPGGGGHPIYASKAGVVVKVVNGYTGYGHYILVDHGDGFQTRYAHNSANYVSVGQYVAQGEVIAAMGRTGWATGNHLHFEVIYNGRGQWPPDYIGYSG